MKTATLSQCSPETFCCSACGLKTPASLPIHITCAQCDCKPCLITHVDEALRKPFTPAPAQRHAAPSGRLRRFALAMARHALNLFQRRTPWEIGALFRKCEACPHFRPAAEQASLRWWQRLLRITPADGSCAKCGCPLARGKQWRNKLAWRSEPCPVGTWQAETLAATLLKWMRRQINRLTRSQDNGPTD